MTREFTDEEFKTIQALCHKIGAVLQEDGSDMELGMMALAMCISVAGTVRNDDMQFMGQLMARAWQGAHDAAERAANVS